MTLPPAGECPFCVLPADRIRESGEHAVALDDAFPVTPGHTLVVSRRHTADLFDLTDAEMASMIRVLRAAKARLDASLNPGGYTVGVNVGNDAGQTVFHVHVHLIPRRPGDAPDPTGGVRNVIPGRGYDPVG
jgi:diadenosine tetraphosphate (Ap4A) HIT family hydrolase